MPSHCFKQISQIKLIIFNNILQISCLQWFNGSRGSHLISCLQWFNGTRGSYLMLCVCLAITFALLNETLPTMSNKCKSLTFLFQGTINTIYRSSKCTGEHPCGSAISIKLPDDLQLYEHVDCRGVFWNRTFYAFRYDVFWSQKFQNYFAIRFNLFS